MASTLRNDFVVLELSNSSAVEGKILEKEISINATDIHNWDLPSIFSAQTIRIQAHRNRLIQNSLYFQGLLGGNFSESSLNHVSVQWDMETVIALLRFIYGCPMQVTIDNFIPLLEGTLFFGIESILLECESWFRFSTSAAVFGSLHISLDDIIAIWNFGKDLAIDFIPEICKGCLAQNFRWAMSCSSFPNIPYKLLHSCIEHPHLTVDSEKQLCEALLVWVIDNKECSGCSSNDSEDDHFEIIRKVRLRLLPLEFVVGLGSAVKRGKSYVSKLANQSIKAIFDMIKDPYLSIQHALVDDESDNFRVRLTQYSEKIDLSGCPQITGALFLLSVLPCPCNMETALKKRLKLSLIELERLRGDECPNPLKSLLTLSFEVVHEIDISKCPLVHVDAVIKWLHLSFPSLRIFRASHNLHSKLTTLCYLVQKFPLIKEVDLAVDISPVIPSRVSIAFANTESFQDLDDPPLKMLKEILLSSNLAKLTLEGRTDIKDLDLLTISAVSGSLAHLNLKGCISLTDTGISKLLRKCMNLLTLVAADTCFGTNSVLALCSDVDHNKSSTLAFRLQQLDIGGCKSVSRTSLLHLMSQTYLLKNLTLRETLLSDDALYDLSGASLESLDVCETMISGTALAYIIRRNPGLKILKASGCRNLSSSDIDLERGEFHPKISSYRGGSGIEELYYELSKACNLDEVAFGWGFSPSSLEILIPAIRTLKVLTVGLGAQLGQLAIIMLPDICPLLESLVLSFQVISDSIVRRILESLIHLRVMGLRYCFGEITLRSFQISMPNLRALRLERVTPWMTNDDLVILARNCKSLNEIYLLGCKLLDSDSQQIISFGWPGLTCIHLEECGTITSNGVSSLLNCKSIEDLSLRHNGRGIRRNFIMDAASKLPLLRKVALDLCDASDGGYDSPSFGDRFFMSFVKIACCKLQKCAFEPQKSAINQRRVHKETIVLEWNSKELRTTIVKERV